jgi:hypothetical protein
VENSVINSGIASSQTDNPIGVLYLYRPNFSPESAVLQMLWDILQTIDKGNVAVLTLLNLSAAYDTVKLGIVLRRLQISFGLDGPALQWFLSYRSGGMPDWRLSTEDPSSWPLQLFPLAFHRGLFADQPWIYTGYSEADRAPWC